jgi:hypothetical protein
MSNDTSILTRMMHNVRDQNTVVPTTTTPKTKKTRSYKPAIFYVGGTVALVAATVLAAFVFDHPSEETAPEDN